MDVIFAKTVLVILLIASNTDSLSHKVGNPDIGGIVLHEKNLFSRYSLAPKNYTIGYKYLNGATLGVIHYVQLDVNGANNSVASIDFSKYVDLSRNRFVNATVFIENATDFIATVEIRGLPGFRLNLEDQLIQITNVKVIKARSYALVCSRTPQNHFNEIRRIYEYGERQTGDFLVHYKNEYGVTNGTHTLKVTFDFYDPAIKIVYVALKVNSQWAIVFHNRVKISDHQFQGTVYELDRKPFVAQLIIFGTRASSG